MGDGQRRRAVIDGSRRRTLLAWLLTQAPS